ncbi:MAG TPA: hypothetical protein VL443_21190 [Cyclobacteriaceae bacterium]|jgi:hypothetical protein|nr:hypothetical protein [Cyclobacteriaceae bacterium]
METNAQLDTQWTDEKILDLICKLRNDLIKDFLDERYLKEYVATNFNIRELSNIKIEFMKKSLKELLIAPIDIIHYEPIIQQIKSTESASLTEGNELLFYKELEGLFKKYVY